METSAIEFMFFFEGQLPSGKNAVLITRQGRRYPAPRFKAWRDAMLRALPHEHPTFTGPVHLTADYYAGDLRRRDLPGMLDAILHVLEKAKLVEDDAQITSCRWIPMGLNRDMPGCLVTLTGAVAVQAKVKKRG